jgi:hypothetical protein
MKGVAEPAASPATGAGPIRKSADFLPAVAELAFELSVAARNLQLYGANHPRSRLGAARVHESLREALRFRPDFELAFTRSTILTGQSYLDRKNPVFCQLASRLWSLGIVGLGFDSDVTEKEVASFLGLLTEAVQKRLGPAAVSRSLPGLGLVHLRVRTLEASLFFDDATTIAAPKGKALDERLEHQLFALSADRAPEGATTPTEAPASKAVADLARRLAGGEKPRDVDYAAAVVSHLREIDELRRRGGGARSGGEGLGELLERLGPALRRQILCAGLVADLSPTATADLVRLFDDQVLLDSLRRLAAEGRVIPMSSYRTLSMLALLDGSREGEGGDEEEAEAEELEQGRYQGLLDALLSEEGRVDYVSGEYEERLETLVGPRSEGAPLPPRAEGAPPFPAAERDRHFLAAAADLARLFPDDSPLVAGLFRQASRVYGDSFGRHDASIARSAIEAGRALRRHGCGLATTPAIWEGTENLDRLIARLGGNDRDEALEASATLAAIGTPAAGRLEELLLSAEGRLVRHLVVDALATLSDDPADRLLPLLERKELPWFVARNVLNVFRRRRSPAAREAAKSLWPSARPKVQIEILRYLYSLHDRGWVPLYREAVVEGSHELAASAARLLSRIRWTEAIEAVMARVEQLHAWEVGSPFHLSLLRALASSRSRSARAFLAASPWKVRCLIPGLRGWLQRAVERILRENPA